MADWSTVDLDDITTNGYDNNSRKSSLQSIGLSENKENKRHSIGSIQTSTDAVGRHELILARGGELNGESRTELSPTCVKNQIVFLEPTTHHVTYTADSSMANVKFNTSTHAPAPTADSNPAETITIPSDANISVFTHDQLAIFLRCLNIEDRVVSHLHRKQVDGKRFGKLKDSDLDTLGINNPVVVFFRNKSNVKSKGKVPFML